jgi:hypothetical protein
VLISTKAWVVEVITEVNTPWSRGRPVPGNEWRSPEMRYASGPMDYKIKSEMLFGIELELVAIADHQFVVSAERIVPSKEHEGGFGQYVDVPEDIEKALLIFQKWKAKIESGEYETPTAPDYEVSRSDRAGAFVGLEPFPELHGLTGGIRRTIRSPRRRP